MERTLMTEKKKKLGEIKANEHANEKKTKAENVYTETEDSSPDSTEDEQTDKYEKEKDTLTSDSSEEEKKRKLIITERIGGFFQESNTKNLDPCVVKMQIWIKNFRFS